MFTSREAIVSRIKLLPLPEMFSDIWNGTAPGLWLALRPAPSRYFDVGRTWMPCCDFDELIPLFEENLEYLYGVDLKTNEYIRYDYRTGTRDVIGRNYQQFIGWIFTDLCYAGLLDVAEEYASAFHFRYLDELRKWAHEEDDLDATEAQQTFVSQLRDESVQH